jgi:hypothetical protein
MPPVDSESVSKRVPKYVPNSTEEELAALEAERGPFLPEDGKG